MSVALFAACGTKTPELTSGIDMTNLDTTANPADDFYQYACGGWMKNNPLDDEHSRYGSFDKLGEDNQQQLRDLVEETAAANNPAGSVASKIATLYNIAMDSTTLQKQDAEPLQPMLQEIAGLKDRDAIISSLPSLHMKGIFAFFGIYN
ncbi:MAG: M13 family peptidase, partial [Bacteroidales bacterium]|nr:M13 family peptidase [Candidatus Colimorpha onthohippi]